MESGEVKLCGEGIKIQEWMLEREVITGQYVNATVAKETYERRKKNTREAEIRTYLKNMDEWLKGR